MMDKTIKLVLRDIIVKNVPEDIAYKWQSKEGTVEPIEIDFDKFSFEEIEHLLNFANNVEFDEKDWEWMKDLNN